MLSRIHESTTSVQDKPFRVELPPKGVPSDSQEQDSVFAGWGACKSCDCRGYVKSGDRDTCTCGHHFKQHR